MLLLPASPSLLSPFALPPLHFTVNTEINVALLPHLLENTQHACLLSVLCCGNLTSLSCEGVLLLPKL